MGDMHRIPRCKDKQYSDPCFERLLSMPVEKLKHNLSPFHIRPAYQYTKAEVGAVDS